MRLYFILSMIIYLKVSEQKGAVFTHTGTGAVTVLLTCLSQQRPWGVAREGWWGLCPAHGHHQSRRPSAR